MQQFPTKAAVAASRTTTQRLFNHDETMNRQMVPGTTQNNLFLRPITNAITCISRTELSLPNAFHTDITRYTPHA